METDDGSLSPTAALGLVASSRSSLADRLVTPWWYHPILGVLVGGLIAVQASSSMVVRALAMGVFGVGLALLVTAYRRLTGLWVSGYHPGPARRWAVMLGVVVGVAYTVAAVAALAGAPARVPLVVGAAVVPVVVVAGRRYDQALRAHLRSPA
jgi:hypothetical protein